MDKNAIKKYAVWARNELIARVAQKANQYGITEAEIISASEDSIHGRLLTPAEKKQRTALIARINSKEKNGYQQVIEEVAYTWFNRLTAIRFMEVNGYLPSHVRVFTDEENRFAPQILAEAIHLEMPGLNMEKVFELKQANKIEELYKYLLITQCNALNEILPGMFQKIEDYTELLLPDNLLREGSVIEQMISLIPEEDWTDQVQIIGWLYQFYNIEPKAAVFAKNGKVSKEEIPAATQLFTPDWIVRYMVENSLGRVWIEGHPNDELKAAWKYYLDEAEQEESVKAQLATIRREYANIKPEEIKVIDPCMGSGHILCYMFDVLVQIYEAYGYTARDAAASIVENNIYGLDIDDRASQLAYFAVMMKARQYDRRFFSRGITPNVYSIEESNSISRDTIEYFSDADEELKTEINKVLEAMKDAKEYGSIVNVNKINYELLYARFDKINDDVSLFRQHTLDALLPLVKISQILSQKYNVAITNPPYMGVSNLSDKVITYVRKNYPDSKTDLFAVFIERCRQFLQKNGLQAMITMHSWMFLSSYEELRIKLGNSTIINLVHLGARAFEEIGGEVVQTCSFVIANTRLPEYYGTFSKLLEGNSQSEKMQMFLNREHLYSVKQTEFKKIPGNPIAYWVSQNMVNIFANNPVIDSIASPRQGLATGNNDFYLREWYEVKRESISTNSNCLDEFHRTQKMYIPYNKGGSYRKWYGNLEYVIKFDPLHYHKLGQVGNHLPSRDLYFRESITWSKVTSGGLSLRYNPPGSAFDVAGCSIFASPELLTYLLALCNANIMQALIRVLSQTMNYEVGTIKAMPVIVDKDKKELIESLAREAVVLSKDDWDAFETSWDFVRHPICPSAHSRREQETSQFANSRMEKFGRLSWHFDNWVSICESRINQLKVTEEKINELFIGIYGLESELTPSVDPESITIRKANLARDIRSFISYAVGCMFGRYSLDVDGIAYAGGEWDDSKYKTFQADKDNVLPICDDEYFEDDIVGKFVKFVEAVYGKDTLEENLKFIADALGGSGSPREVIRSYFLNDFYADHLKIYQKRPIYWQFDSGKKNGFKCLIYMHRYQPDTIARIRTDYVHEQQARYRTAIADLEQRIQVASTSERVKLTKLLQKLKDQETEIRLFEEKVHHLADQMIRIDLDDGVKANYNIFKDVLTKLK